MSQKLIQIVKAVKAVRRIERPVAWQPHKPVTFFSVHDVWLYVAVMDSKVCEQCRKYEDIGRFRGNHLRATFPYLEIVGTNTIMANVHPNCRCFLFRIIEKNPQVILVM